MLHSYYDLPTNQQPTTNNVDTRDPIGSKNEKQESSKCNSFKG